MRDIKFRAWDKYEKEMHIVSKMDWNIFSEEIETISTGYKDNTCLAYNRNHSSEKCDIEALELMQYTGLKDKNGKEIYEGDILLAPSWFGNLVCVCIYQQENQVSSIQGFGLYSYDTYFQKYRNLVESDEWDEFEVIGNIYDNPELLEVKHE